MVRHVLGCDICWAEIFRLQAAIAALRTSPEIVPLPLTAEAIAMVKLSGKKDRAFAGHLTFALTAASLHAALYTASVGHPNSSPGSTSFQATQSRGAGRSTMHID